MINPTTAMLGLLFEIIIREPIKANIDDIMRYDP
jgi:hypothetical protein